MDSGEKKKTKTGMLKMEAWWSWSYSALKMESV